MTEEYTNKAGFTNVRKTAIYLALETLRRDIINHGNLEKRVAQLESNQKWVVRMVVGAVVLTVLAFIGLRV